MRKFRSARHTLNFNFKPQLLVVMGGGGCVFQRGGGARFGRSRSRTVQHLHCVPAAVPARFRFRFLPPLPSPASRFPALPSSASQRGALSSPACTACPLWCPLWCPLCALSRRGLVSQEALPSALARSCAFVLPWPCAAARRRAPPRAAARRTTRRPAALADGAAR
jgi:hypothetical protein